MWQIRQQGDTWELVDASGEVLATGATYGDVLARLGTILDLARDVAAGEPDAGGDDGLLDESWTAPIAFLSEPTGPLRDFTNTEWTWRDPAESLLPLMLHTETDMGHFGAQLAGFVTSIGFSDGVGTMAGRFYDSEEGRGARDLLLGGRRFGVSVDPGEETEAEFECTEEDEDGFCVAERMSFLRYEVIGLTMTPFPGFARAHVVLDEQPAEAVAAAAVASTSNSANVRVEVIDVREGSVHEPCPDCEERAAAFRAIVAANAPLAPPAEWFTDPGFTEVTAPRWTDEGRVMGHLAGWGQCHTGYPGRCEEPPRSLSGYAYFRTGYVVCADGSEVATGVLSLGGGHANESLGMQAAIEHYDNVASAVADVAMGEDAYGIWYSGALRSGVTDEQLRVLRASPPSGDWRPVGTGLELVAACAVNSQGFPIARVASGRVVALVAAGSGPVRVAARREVMPTQDDIDAMRAISRELGAVASASARARLRQAAGDRQRERLRALVR